MSTRKANAAIWCSWLLATEALQSQRSGQEQQPGIGRPDLPDKFRESMIEFGESGYRALQHIDSKVVTVLAVLCYQEVGY